MLAISFGLLICLASLSDEVVVPPSAEGKLRAYFQSSRGPSVSPPSVRVPSVPVPSVSLPSIEYSLQGGLSTANAKNQLEQEVTLRLPSSRGPSVSLPSVSIPSVRVPSVPVPSVSLTSIENSLKGVPSTANAKNQLEQEATLRLPLSGGPSVSLPSVSLPPVSIPSVPVPSVSLTSIENSLKGVPSTANAKTQLEQEVTLRLPSSRGPSVSLPSISLQFNQGPSSTANDENQLEQEWSDFKVKYNKIYPSLEEEAIRKEVFFENREKVLQYNIEYTKGLRNFVSRINTYADLLHHEFTKRFNGFNSSSPDAATSGARRHFPSTFIPSANVEFPESVDWRKVGAVGPVKHQGQCASCYAFAAAGALESQWFRKTGQLVNVSVQNLLDCSDPQGNFGCRSGFITASFAYVGQNRGVDSEPSYPYEAKANQCRFTPENSVATLTGYVVIPRGDEKALEDAVATIGPITAAIDAERQSFQFWSDGIYDDPTCLSQPNQMNHAVLIVGYGQEIDGRKYWLVKNSYGTEWGIGGYIKIAKDNNNQCGIATSAVYPLV